MTKKQKSGVNKKTLLVLVLLGVLLSLITLGLQATPTSSQDAYLLEQQSDAEGQIQFTVKEKIQPVSEDATVTFTVKKRN